MASPDGGANTQQNTKEEKPDVSLQIVVKAQVRSVSSWPFLSLVVRSAVIQGMRLNMIERCGACAGRLRVAVQD
jgi:hypothetical protein